MSRSKNVVAHAPVVAIEAPAVHPILAIPPHAPVVQAKVRYAARTWSGASIITVLVANPKSGASRTRFDLYTSGMSVAQYQQAVGSKTLATADLRWDVARGFITIE